MPAFFSFAMTSMNCDHVFGGWTPAFAKSSLLYQKPTTPTLYGMAYCRPLTCQPAAEPPIVLIQLFTNGVRSLTFFALTWSTRPPPPQFWKMSGGLLDCKPIGIFVFRFSFWSGTDLILTLGCAFWNSLMAVVHNFKPSPWVALCHHTRVCVFCD